MSYDYPSQRLLTCIPSGTFVVHSTMDSLGCFWTGTCLIPCVETLSQVRARCDPVLQGQSLVAKFACAQSSSQAFFPSLFVVVAFHSFWKKCRSRLFKPTFPVTCNIIHTSTRQKIRCCKSQPEIHNISTITENKTTQFQSTMSHFRVINYHILIWTPLHT